MKNLIDRLTNAFLCLCFTKFSGPDLSALAKAIVRAMTGNLFFTGTPDPTIASIDDLVTAYDKAAAAAKSRDRNAVMAKGIARGELITGLQALGRWCMAQANGNRQMLESTAFPMGKRGSKPVPPIDVPKNLIVMDGPVPYSIKIIVDSDPQYNGFMFQYSEDEVVTPDTVWISEPSSVREFIFYNLTPKKSYWFRVKVFGSKKQVRVTDAISRVAQ